MSFIEVYSRWEPQAQFWFAICCLIAAAVVGVFLLMWFISLLSTLFEHVTVAIRGWQKPPTADAEKLLEEMKASIKAFTDEQQPYKATVEKIWKYVSGLNEAMKFLINGNAPNSLPTIAKSLADLATKNGHVRMPTDRSGDASVVSESDAK